jgi:hypothetical protein
MSQECVKHANQVIATLREELEEWKGLRATAQKSRDVQYAYRRAAEREAENLREEKARALQVLDTKSGDDLEDACRQVKQVAISEADNSEKLEAMVASLRRWKDELTDIAVVSWVLSEQNKDNPRLMIADITKQAVTEALDPLISAEANALIETAFKAGYHCRWQRDGMRYTFDPALAPGDPEGAYAAWRKERK